MTNPIKKKILIVGAGFAGATIARELADSGRYVIDIIDQRNHIAGNAYDPIHKELNLRIHQYGPHIFHTNDQRIFSYLSRFTEWLMYTHKVEAWVDNSGYVPLPINRTTLNKLFKINLNSESDVRLFLNTIKCHHTTPNNARKIAENIYGIELTELFFGRYTEKMWGISLSELAPEVLARLPIRYNDNTNYFNDKIQAMPKLGYITLIENMLDHYAISVALSCNFKRNMEKKYHHIFNSMPIDVYFNNKYGALPYRSIRFIHEKVTEHTQPVPTINFTDEGIYTRQTDWRLYPGYTMSNQSEVLLTKEIPCSYEDNNLERYYPIKTISGEPQKIYQKYCNEAKNLNNITFIGRCGQYIYYDMHQVVANSLKIAKHFLRLN